MSVYPEMKDYEVIVRETLERKVIVRAKNGIEAIDKVEEMYRKEEIVLDAEDMTGDADFLLRDEPEISREEVLYLNMIDYISSKICKDVDRSQIVDYGDALTFIITHFALNKALKLRDILEACEFTYDEIEEVLNDCAEELT